MENMSDFLTTGCFFAFFIALGYLFNSVAEKIYWKWVIWKNRER
jgi:hypothetical protein